MNETCPLCAGSCDTKQSADVTVFWCDECKPFRATRLALKALAALTDAQRGAIKSLVLAAYQGREILEIRRAPLDSDERFTFTRLPVP